MKKNVVLLPGSFLVVLISVMCSFSNSQVSQKATEVAALEGTLKVMEADMTLQAAEMTENDLIPESSATEAIVPTAPEAAATGSISGKLSYPSDFIPALRIVAFEVVNDNMTGNWYSVDSEMNQFTYQMDNLPEGKYYVVAYIRDADENSLRAGYTPFVPCGLSVSCTDHSLIAVEVKNGSMTEGVDPGDWYVDPSNFPPDPSQQG